MPTNTKPGWVLALTSIASLMVLLDAMVVTTALTTIRLDLGATIEQLEWTVNAYTLTFAVLLATAAALGDRYGRRRLFTIGLTVFTVASAACALSPGIGALIAARAVQGVGSAMVMPHAMALLAAAYPPERRARALGVFSSVSGLATLGGPVAGGAIAQGGSWQWIFWLNVPIGAVLIALVRVRIPESTGPGHRLDVGGLALAAAGALGLVWGLIKGNDAGWTSPEVLGSLTAGVAALAAFVAWELRVERPMLPMRLFARRGFAAGNASGFLLYTAIFGSAFLMAQFFQVTEHTGPLGAGVRMMPWTATLFLIAPVAGALINRVGERPLLTAGLAGQAIGFGSLALLATPGRPYPQLILPLVIAGCGVSLAMPAAQNATIGAVPRESIGTASGTFNTLRQLGGVFGVAILAAVFTAQGGYGSPEAFAAGFRPALGVAALLSIAGAAAGGWIPGRPVSSEAAAPPVPRPVGADARTAVR
ncbi:DHA2 family efflux MFS transporter permease subunit [Microbispora sp. RL4-1S]|uniref:DHA2 family efflux MFS transporter permease subunit n=1 Tax=Microbispora oryzae TaxID=2806554 RepID=A0A940WSX8_9ACTN|nr:DHA2 family efflux MFS transporter permease subunit [Microbispora oryzae]MBP2706845.1 DHA2 family efflux MFS transporter permease subunit [Microbispora oryzae]